MEKITIHDESNHCTTTTSTCDGVPWTEQACGEQECERWNPLYDDIYRRYPIERSDDHSIKASIDRTHALANLYRERLHQEAASVNWCG